jgi:hypothetical protein
MCRFAVVVLLCEACASAQGSAGSPGSVHYLGGDGSNCAAAVQIVGAEDERAGVQAEHDWLSTHRPGHAVVKQGLTSCSGRSADILTIVMPDGSTQDVFFDISDFFGRF